MQELIPAYWSIESIYNLYSINIARIEANREAFVSLSPEHFMDQYGDFANHKAHQASVEMKQKLALSVGLTAALVLASVVAPAAGHAVEEETAVAIAGSLAIYKENINMGAGVIAGFYSGLNSIGAASYTIKAGKPE